MTWWNLRCINHSSSQVEHLITILEPTFEAWKGELSSKSPHLSPQQHRLGYRQYMHCTRHPKPPHNCASTFERSVERRENLRVLSQRYSRPRQETCNVICASRGEWILADMQESNWIAYLEASHECNCQHPHIRPASSTRSNNRVCTSGIQGRDQAQEKSLTQDICISSNPSTPKRSATQTIRRNVQHRYIQVHLSAHAATSQVAMRRNETQDHGNQHEGCLHRRVIPDDLPPDRM
jgi:hypothetical protein